MADEATQTIEAEAIAQEAPAPAPPPAAETVRHERTLPMIQAGGPIRALVPQSLDDAFRMARAIALSGLAPDSMKRAEQILVAIMHGAEIGLAPMQAVQSIAVINGRPSLWGDASLGLVRASGLMEWISETYEGTPYEDGFKAVCRVKRKGEPEGEPFEFSVADAKLASLWNKKTKAGGPTPWVTHPKRMLKMRARAFALRDTFADVLRGLAIREEMEDAAMINEVERDPNWSPFQPSAAVPQIEAAGDAPVEAPAEAQDGSGDEPPVDVAFAEEAAREFGDDDRHEPVPRASDVLDREQHAAYLISYSQALSRATQIKSLSALHTAYVEKNAPPDGLDDDLKKIGGIHSQRIAGKLEGEAFVSALSAVIHGARR